MPIHDFSTSESDGFDYGGKANTLARLTRAGFPVPPALALSQPPNENEWTQIRTWWESHGGTPLAVRSSACGEDGADLSFAGQHDTLLNVGSSDALKGAVSTCFASMASDHARSYRSKMGLSDDDVRMNVVLQLMVQPKYAGVYFSVDPRGSTQGCLIEYVEGLGEDLVSGRVSPSRITEAELHNTETSEFTAVRDWGEKAQALLEYPLDMEWAIDCDDAFHVLQCRPITTDARNQVDGVGAQVGDLKARHEAGTAWDGQPFAEWPGQASPAGFSLWARAFSKGHAFDAAMRRLGYRGFSSDESLLDNVLGRPYVNLGRLMPCFYGPLPCRMIADPEPHLIFHAPALSLKSILNLPGALGAMLRVAGRMSSSRTEMLKECRDALAVLQKHLAEAPADADGVSTAQTVELLKQEYDSLTRDAFMWPLALIMLVQSTTKTLETHLAKTEPAGTANATLQKWMSAGLQTATMEMHMAQQAAAGDTEAEVNFLDQYGHRGPGELDIARPRWSEPGHSPFAHKAAGSLSPAASAASLPAQENSESSGIVAQHIEGISSVRKTLIAQEWDFLREMLELREIWKMTLMKSFFRIRKFVLALGKSSGLEEDVFFLTLDEMIERLQGDVDSEALGVIISERKHVSSVLTGISLPEVLSLRTLDVIMSGSPLTGDALQKGTALSPGLAEGEVRVVMGDPAVVDLSTWPEDVILVTESTDPGWTPLFARVRGIVVEKGGVLSHCAIVAREMQIPAVSQIPQCYRQYKDGQRLWVDGLKGTVRTDAND